MKDSPLDILCWAFYYSNLRKCEDYYNDEDVRLQMGIGGYLEAYLTAVAAEQLIDEKSIEERLAIFRIIEADTRKMGAENFSGSETERLERINSHCEFREHFHVKFLG